MILQDAVSDARLQLTIALLGEQRPALCLTGHGGCAGTPNVPVWPLWRLEVIRLYSGSAAALVNLSSQEKKKG